MGASDVTYSCHLHVIVYVNTGFDIVTSGRDDVNVKTVKAGCRGGENPGILVVCSADVSNSPVESDHITSLQRNWVLHYSLKSYLVGINSWKIQLKK